MISRVKKTLKNPDKWAGVFVLLINNRITGINLKMTEQFIGITDYPEAQDYRKIGHCCHHRSIHLAGEVAVKGFAT